METVGELFGDGSYFLPEMLCSVDAYGKCFALIEPRLKQGEFVLQRAENPEPQAAP